MQRPTQFNLFGGGTTIIDLDDVKMASICFVTPEPDPADPLAKRVPVQHAELTLLRMVWGAELTVVAPLESVWHLLWVVDTRDTGVMSTDLIDDVIESARVLLEAWNLEVAENSAQYKRDRINRAVRDLSTAVLGFDVQS